MSTENEGAGVTPPTRTSVPEQQTAQPAPPADALGATTDAPKADAPGTDRDAEDFALAEPRSAQAPAGAPAEVPAPAPRTEDDTAVLTAVPAAAAESAPHTPNTPDTPRTQPGGYPERSAPPVPPAPPAGQAPAAGQSYGPYAAQAQSGAPGGGWGAPTGGSGGYGGGYAGGTPPPSGPGGGMPPSGPHDPWATPMPPSPGAGNGKGRRRTGALLAAVVAAALVGGGVGGGVGYLVADRDGGSSTTVSTEASSQALNRSPESVAGIADKALPSVVTIESGGGGEQGTGTGFVYDEQGHIVTNNHVVANAAEGGKLSVTFSDGKSYDASIVGRAEGYDIAVLKLEDAGGRSLDPLPLGNSDQMAVGDTTIAIGAPFGLSGTVTTGIISAKNRPVASSDGQGSDASYMNALQTDASINPGNSGGPLLNAQGAVIGVNSAIQSGGGGGVGQGQPGSIGLGFAIPINQTKRVAEQLIDTGTPVYPVIGVRVNMDTQQGGAEGGEQGGAVIAGDEEAAAGEEPITPNGPADKAGLQPGDVITEFDGAKIDSGPTLIARIWAKQPEETVKITYIRDGKSTTTDITLGSRKGDEG